MNMGIMTRRDLCGKPWACGDERHVAGQVYEDLEGRPSLMEPSRPIPCGGL